MGDSILNRPTAFIFMKSWIASLFSRSDAATAASSTTVAERFDDLIRRGQALEDGGELNEALLLYQQALRLEPFSARALINLGNVKSLLNDDDAARSYYQRALDFEPDNSSALLNLGNAQLAGQLYEAAALSYRRAIAARPDWVEAHIGLACALDEQQLGDEALECYRTALQLNPAHTGAAFNASVLLLERGAGDEARLIVTRCLEHVPEDPPLIQRLSEIERDAGNLKESVKLLRRLAGGNPDSQPIQSIYLFNLNFLPDITAEEILAQHLEFGSRLEASIVPHAFPVATADDGERRLRIGYLSADFKRHPVANFIAPVLRNHDRHHVEVFCYYMEETEDNVTQWLRGLSDHWRDVSGMTDDEFFSSIRADKIDILVDLSGHTAGNRIGIFARRAAPVQITWLGYLGTTGLSRMDYRLCDAHTDPAALAESWQTETPLRMPDSQWCYEPIGDMPGPSPLPRLSNGYWTFGSFNNGRKLNEVVLMAWAEILKSLPESRLLIFGMQTAEGRRWVSNCLLREGIDASRVEIFDRLPVDHYFAAFGKVDVALDTFPYNGATTTCDALMMGVPVLTVSGRRSLSRGGVSLLKTIGLDTWIAESESDLAKTAVALLTDIAEIEQLRASLPLRMKASPLMDAERYCRNLERKYRWAWHQSIDRAGAQTRLNPTS